MKTSNQKYRRSHWWKFTDWGQVFWIALLGVIVGAGIYGIIWVIVEGEKLAAAANDSITDSVQVDSVAVDSIPDSTLVVDSVPTKSEEETKSEEKTKSDPAVFDTTIENTRVVIKTNRRIKVIVK